MNAPRLHPFYSRCCYSLVLRRAVAVVFALALVGLAGLWLGSVSAHPSQSSPLQLDPVTVTGTLRVYGYPVVSNPNHPAAANLAATAGSDQAVDPYTGLLPEDPPYTRVSGPFDPLSPEAPRMDFVTWDPAWISERLVDQGLQDEWPGLTGIDEVSAGSHIRAGGLDGSEKVWFRHWYEPQHLDKDLNADERLTDDDNDGVPDAELSGDEQNIDEWYPAIMTELTYMLVENDPLPQADPAPSALHRSAPRQMCGAVGSTDIVFPVGVEESETDPAGPAEGYGLTSLDVDFDGRIDMVHVTDEENLPGVIGAGIDFDFDGLVDALDPDNTRLTCDEMAVFHTDAMRIGLGEQVQFLDHLVKLVAVTDNAALLEIVYMGDLQPKPFGPQLVGNGAVVIAGDVGQVRVIPPGGDNFTDPTPLPGSWFAHVVDSDSGDDTAIVILGRALGAACASMESLPNVPNRSEGGPWHLKRFYVDGHEYNVAAIYTCDRDEFGYITLRAPLPKVPAVIDQHSVRLAWYGEGEPLALPPPFNYEHTILEDIVALEGLEPLLPPPDAPLPVQQRPEILYMGGPIGPIPPVLGGNDSLPYEGRNPAEPIDPPYEDPAASRWLYVAEETDPQRLGQLKEKYGAVVPGTDNPAAEQESFFYNEQMWTLPWHYTEFLMPNQADDQGDPALYDADKYLVTSAFVSPYARWRRWRMPDTGVGPMVPPLPEDLVADFTPPAFPLGEPRRAGFWFDPDEEGKLFMDSDGVRLYGGVPEPEGYPCDPGRPSLELSAGDLSEREEATTTYGVEILPYTDPWAPFNPQHAHAPRSDSLTFNPAYMDETRNTGEDLADPQFGLYRQLSNGAMNAREKVYHRLWYEPDYLDKIRYADDCERDLRFPALVQEYTYMYLDMTDNPVAVPAGSSKFGFPIGTRSDELPEPEWGTTVLPDPEDSEFGYGLTTFDADFDEVPDAVTVHSERTLASYLDTQWQSNRPTFPGYEPDLKGPELDFDGDGYLDTLDSDGVPLNGNEMVVFAVESVILDQDTATPFGTSAMVMDHLVTLENVTAGSSAQFRLWFTGGRGSRSVPEPVGLVSLEIGEAAIVDRFQGNKVTIVGPESTEGAGDNRNLGADGAWFVFVEDVATGSDLVVVTVGRALGATHSAIDNGNGGHDLVPGDPWYLKRFYVDGHEYNVTAIKTTDLTEIGNLRRDFEWITIRTPVPKGNYFNPQDTLQYQGYFLDGLPAETSVMPPFNVRHTVASDVAKIELEAFANTREYESCVGELAAAEPLTETILAEEIEPRFGSELREIATPRVVYDPDPRPLLDDLTWMTDQLVVTPYEYTELSVPAGQTYLLTLNWVSPVSRLHYYGCTRQNPGPFNDYEPALTQAELASLAEEWAPPPGIVMPPNQLFPPQPEDPFPGDPPIIAPYYDAALSGPPVRVKLFYDPADASDAYVNRNPREILGEEQIAPTEVPPTEVPPTAVPPTAVPPTDVPPTEVPTAEPTAVPPTEVPPTDVPPTEVPPTDVPPTAVPPTEEPTAEPTAVSPTDQPTDEPTEDPTDEPTEEPTTEPAVQPTDEPTDDPTDEPTAEPTDEPTTEPVVEPTEEPTAEPTAVPTAEPTAVPTEEPVPGAEDSYCLEGEIYLQGRADHAGMAVYMDGEVVATTESDGSYEACDLQAGVHEVTTGGGCYLETVPFEVQIQEELAATLPALSLTGGDVTGDGRIGLQDLVRSAADFQSSPPTDPAADCTGDEVVNLFDLVLVATNYGLSGPVTWQSGAAPEAKDAALSYDLADPQKFGPDGGAEVTLVERGLDGATGQVRMDQLQDENTLVVDVLARDLAGLYGTELRLVYDPEQVSVVDTSTRPGVQVVSGSAWESDGSSYIAVNDAHHKLREIRFVASRTSPSQPLAGEQVLMSVTFKLLDGAPSHAYALTHVEMRDSGGEIIPARWQGVEPSEPRTYSVFMPLSMTGRGTR